MKFKVKTIDNNTRHICDAANRRILTISFEGKLASMRPKRKDFAARQAAEIILEAKDVPYGDVKTKNHKRLQ